MDFHQQIAAKTDEELIDIYIHSDDYQADFVYQAEQELINRGVSLEKYRTEKEFKTELLKKGMEHGRKGNELYITLGFVSALLGGFIGIVAGFVYSQSKQDGPSGERYYVYDKQTRNKGRIMMVVGLFAFAFAISLKFS